MHALGDAWPYLGLFVTLFLTGIGVPPLPEEATVVVAGIAAGRAELVLWAAWPACTAGVISADVVLYWLGRAGGRSVLRGRWVERALTPARRERLEGRLRGHGVMVILTARLVPGLRTGVFVLAGALRYPFPRFLLIDGLAALLSVGFVLLGSYYLTESFARVFARPVP